MMDDLIHRLTSVTVVAFLSLCTAGGPLIGMDENSDFRIEKSLELKRNSGGAIEFLFDLEKLPAGKQGLIVLNLVNTTDEEFAFSSIASGCGCLKVRALGDRIPARGKLEVEARIKTPTSVRDLFQRTGFFLKHAPGVGVTVHLQYTLSGALAFPEKLHLTAAALDSENHTFLVPILFSDPVRKENLAIEGIDGLQLTRSQCVEKDGNDYIACTVKLEGLGKGPTNGTLRVLDRVTGREAAVRVMIDSPNLVSVAPAVIRTRLVASPGQKDGSAFTGALIVRVHPDVIDMETGDVAIKLSSSLADFRYESTRVSKGVYRLKVFFATAEDSRQGSNPAPSGNKGSIKWSVVTKKLSREGDIEVEM
ncbi:MAG: hypothetical protein U0892_23280 [Pirellulales bacterium]